MHRTRTDRRFCAVAAACAALAMVGPPASASTPIDITAMLTAGAVAAEHTPFDIGAIESVFDGNTTTIARTPGVNPLVITLTFDEAQEFIGFQTWFQAQQNRWRVEGADSRADLDAGTGSYRVLVDWLTDDQMKWSVATLPSPETCTVVRYSLDRLTGDDYVHLAEWELLRPDRPSESFQILSISSPAPGPGLTWTSDPGQWYAVESGDDLGDWTPVDWIKGGGPVAAWTDPDAVAGLKRFYRVATAVPEDRPWIVKKILVLNYDPILESEQNQRVHKYFRWNNPRTLTDDYLADLNEVSGDYVRWEIVDFVDIDEYPIKTDGFRYTDESYLDAWATGTFHSPDSVDYSRIVDDWNLDDRVRDGEIDEVIVWGAPYFGYYESRMVGSTTYYWCNSPSLYRANTPLFVMMGLNYERGVAEAIHSFGHRAESIMRRVYGSWSSDGTINHLWDRFTRFEMIAPGVAACGNVHFPPNGTSDYDYGNSGYVWSEADNWLNYPNLTGAQRWINSSEWGSSQRGYLKWWYRRMPQAPGRHPDGQLNNWWAYLVDMNEYPESR